MADPKHLAILRQGVPVWNKWREEEPDVQPDLSKANLSGVDLSEADLTGADLSEADLTGAHLFRAYLGGTNLGGANLGGAYLNGADLNGADLSEADLRGASLGGAILSRTYLNRANLSETDLTRADLTRADLRGAFLRWADLYWAFLREADLRGAHLNEADLRGADLTGTDLRWANLSRADLSRANLSGANLSGADLETAVFGDVDLSQVLGLESVRHRGPSTIGIDTIYKSGGNIPHVFLRGCGVPDNFIEYMASLTGKAWEYYSCFISYSNNDEKLARLIHDSLQGQGVRCWFAPEDMKIGDKIRPRIDEAIRSHDKLLLILSQHSVESDWVEKEVETAFEQERQRKSTVLFPVRLDDTVMDTEQAWAADIRRTRHIGDFRGWKNHDAYTRASERLLRDLKADPTYLD